MNTRCTALLREALDLPESERRQFLERASAGDVALLANLIRLLELDDDTDPFLDAPLDGYVARLLADDVDPEVILDDVAPGDRIGPWKVISKLGSGGMGSVWLAERADGVYSQKVALKTIKLGMDSAMVLDQFHRERNLLARLQHPNIASLIDGGVDDRGRPWFAMDHVQGIDLRDWIKTQPSLSDRLRLFEKICRAAAHAHQQLVIHRDIKPGNVLVQADGEPKLLDFGIAKLLAEDDVDETVTLQRFVSRSYAAPEQLRGEAVSTATDVYALGALLFEILTGERYAHVHQTDTAPMPPSQALRQPPDSIAVPATRLRGDLDAIVTRALADEPARRYATALSLAEDVRNHLDGKPINARPDGFAYRANKFVRRNRAAVAIALFGLLGLLLTSGLALWQAHAKTEEAARTQVALKRSEAIRSFIESVFLDADPARARGENTTAGELLDAARSRVAKDLGDQPDIAATMLNQIGKVYVSLDKDVQARAVLQEASEMNARSTHPSLSVEASATAYLAMYDYYEGNTDRAMASLDRVIALLRADGGLPAELSMALQMKAPMLFSLERFDEALAVDAEAVSVLVPHADTLGSEYAMALVAYAGGASGNRKGELALQLAERALALPVLQNDNAPALRMLVLGEKAHALSVLKRDAEAELVLEAAIQGSTQLYGADGARTRYWVYLQAQTLQALERLDEAQKAIDSLVTRPSSDPEQPLTSAAYSVAAASIAVSRHAPDTEKRVADAVAIACGPTGNPNFCEKARSIKVAVD